MIPIIYTDEEYEDRLRFTSFLSDYFKIRKGTISNDFKYPLDVDIIFGWYQQRHPDTLLDVATVTHMLSVMGVKDVTRITLDVRPGIKMPIELTKLVRGHLQPDKAIEQLQVEPAELTLTPGLNALNLFIDLFMVEDKETKTSTAEIFDLYSCYCMHYNLQTLSKQEANRVFRRRIGDIRKGYVKGKSGMPYLYVRIPEQEYWEMSILIGLGLFVDNVGRVVDNKNKIMCSDVDELDQLVTPNALLQQYIDKRTSKRRYGIESPRTPKKRKRKDMGSDVTRRETQKDISDDSGGTQTSVRRAPGNSEDAALLRQTKADEIQGTRSKDNEHKDTKLNNTEDRDTKDTDRSTHKGDQRSHDKTNSSRNNPADERTSGRWREARRTDTNNSQQESSGGLIPYERSQVTGSVDPDDADWSIKVHSKEEWQEIQEQERAKEAREGLPTDEEVFKVLAMYKRISVGEFTKKDAEKVLKDIGVPQTAEDIWLKFQAYWEVTEIRANDD